MRITLLGTGSSAGVPMLGCGCAVCTSSDPRNTRSRASIAVADKGTTLLVDSAPDLRQQALSNQLTHIDALLYTHVHADHTHGIDDLRSFNYLANQPLATYADQETFASLQERFPYAFLPAVEGGWWFRPCLVPHIITPYQSFEVGALSIMPFTQTHGRTTSLGFRFGDMAYSTDVNSLDERAFAALEGISVWVVDCLRFSPAPTHAHLELTLTWIERLKPARAILTHMGHDFEYQRLQAYLPEGVEPGYDGMVIEGEW